METGTDEGRIGVVAYERDQRPDTALAQAVQRLQVAGLTPRGLLQHGKAGCASTCAALFLDDIGTGREIQIFENRGAATRGCRLDPSGLAVAASWLREAVEARPHVLFVNRFGQRECEGQGLREEIGAVVVAGIPIVIAVSKLLLPRWRAFAGEDTTMLAADPEQIEGWCARSAQAARA